MISQNLGLYTHFFKLYVNYSSTLETKGLLNTFFKKEGKHFNLLQFLNVSYTDFKKSNYIFNTNTLSYLLLNPNFNKELLFRVSRGNKFTNIFYFNWVESLYNTIFYKTIDPTNKNFVKYLNTNISKYINPTTLGNYTVYFLRKSKIFNKGRYSRNRQFYRTGVYWCLYLSIILFTGLYYWFYHFIINFGFFWWFFFLLIASFILPKTLKYRYYNILFE
jgi:hypothetical protein